jgi:hypothetical protein
LALLAVALASCTQGSNPAFSQASPSPLPQASPAQLDLRALADLRAQASAAVLQHLNGGNLDLSWGTGPPSQLAGPYNDATPETDAMALQALRTIPATGAQIQVAASATADAYKQLDGPRGGAYLLLLDAAHPPPPGPPAPVDPTPIPCPTPTAGRANPDCLRRQVSDGLLAAWYAGDTKMFFKVGETSTVYRPVDAIAVGCALIVAGIQEKSEPKIQAGAAIVQKEMLVNIDSHFGMVQGLVTATAQGGHDVTDHNARLADQAGAAEMLLEAFDYTREQQYQGFAQKLLEPLLNEQVPLRLPSGGYVSGFDLQSTGPGDHLSADVEATLLVLQAARHYDRDDGGHFARLEETAANALTGVLDADRAKGGGAPAAGLPALVPETGVAVRSGLTTALAVVVLADVARDFSTSPPPTGGGL